MTIFRRDDLRAAFPGNPRMVAALERLDALLTGVDANGKTLTDRLDALTANDAAGEHQKASPLLDAISALPNRVGAIEVTQEGEAAIRPIDGQDPASLLSRGAAYTVLVGAGGMGPTSGRPALPAGYVALYFDTTIDPDGQPIFLRADGVWVDGSGVVV